MHVGMWSSYLMAIGGEWQTEIICGCCCGFTDAVIMHMLVTILLSRLPSTVHLPLARSICSVHSRVLSQAYEHDHSV